MREGQQQVPGTPYKTDDAWYRPSNEEWRDRANCAGTDPTTAIFFPAQGSPLAAARAICKGCEVRADCLDYALVHRIVWGVWGGLSEKERRSIRRARSREVQSA